MVASIVIESGRAIVLRRVGRAAGSMAMQADAQDRITASGLRADLSDRLPLRPYSGE